MSAFAKDIRRSIRGSLGRFLAIAGIAALGVGFYAGLQMTEPDMLVSADTYYDDYDLMDVRVVSTLGFSDDDISKLETLDGVETVMASRETDVLASVGSEQYAMRIHSIDGEDGDASNQLLNKLQLAEGRWPEKSGECVMLADAVLTEPVKIGDKVSAIDCISKMDETLAETEFTVVGFVHSPYYTCSSNLGSTSIGSSSIKQVIYVLPQDFDSDLPPTEVFISVDGASDELWGTEDYDRKVDVVLAALAEKQPDWEADRTRQVKDEAQKKVDDAKAELEDAQAELDSSASDAYSQLDDALAQLESAAATIDSSSAQLDSARNQAAQAQSQLDASRQDAEAQFAQAEAQLDELEAAQAQIDQGQAQLDGAWAAAGMSYDQALALPDTAAALEAQMQALDPESEEYAALSVQLEQVNGAIAATQPLIAQQQAFDESRAQFEAALAQVGSVETGRQQIADQRAAAEQEFAQAQSQIDQAYAQISSGQSSLESGIADYQSGLSQYESSRAQAEQKIADGQAEIDDGRAEIEKAQADVDAIEDASWYVLDRSKNYGCASYKGDAERIGNIAAVFPLIFFLVAALVALTTMTRMVEEERVMIGTYKALGYGKGKIALKYLAYAAIATVAGSIVGTVILSLALPYVVQTAYAIIYYVPKFMLPFDLGIAFISGGLGFVIVLGATLAALIKTLREKPAELMLPRAPKAGKRILLECIPALWKRVSFSWKVTFRNLFRYKKRLFMTLIGIAGCTALLLTGLGLSDSINDIIDKQYGPIIKYDTVISCEDDISQQSKDELESLLSEGESEHPHAWAASTDLLAAPEDAPQIACTVLVPQDPDSFDEFVSLHSRKEGDPLALQGDGAIVTEKIASLMGVGVGDTLVLNEQDDSGNMTGVTHEIPIAGIAENYTGHYVYLTADAYRQIWGEDPVFDKVLVDGADEHGNHAQFSSAVREIEGINTVAFNKDVVETYREMLASVNMVVVVLVLAAAALAFIVLYNLTNINIMERQREIATLKVLGFLPREVSAYIFRETMILSAIGALIGLVLGVFMEGFVVITAEVEMVMFGRVIHPTSFIGAFVLTLVFTLIVMLVMRRRLAKVDMVESLKSVE